MNSSYCPCENNNHLPPNHLMNGFHPHQTNVNGLNSNLSEEDEKIVLYGYNSHIHDTDSDEAIARKHKQIHMHVPECNNCDMDNNSLCKPDYNQPLPDYNQALTDYPVENYIFGMVNVKKMLIAPILKCFEQHHNVVLEIDYEDFLYPITFIDNNQKTNNNIPFLYSVESLIYQLTNAGSKKFVFIMQFFVENCMYHASFSLENICNVPGYQVLLFTKMLSGADDLYKLFQKLNGCNKKIEAYGICMSFYLSGGKIISPCNNKCDKKKKVKKYCS